MHFDVVVDEIGQIPRGAEISWNAPNADSMLGEVERWLAALGSQHVGRDETALWMWHTHRTVTSDCGTDHTAQFCMCDWIGPVQHHAACICIPRHTTSIAEVGFI